MGSPQLHHPTCAPLTAKSLYVIAHQDTGSISSGPAQEHNFSHAALKFEKHLTQSENMGIKMQVNDSICLS